MSEIFYLAQKYRGIEMESFMNACKWTKQLLDKGYFVFSPILHSHPFSLEMGNKVEGQKCPYRINDDCNHPKGMFVDEDCMQYNGDCIIDDPIDESGIDWLEWDIKILDALHKGDGGHHYHEDILGHVYHKDIYDSVLTMIFASDCVKILYIKSKDGIQLGSLKEIEDANKTKLLWYSVGAETEYKWAKEHHVKCVLLDDVLNKPENEWRAI